MKPFKTKEHLREEINLCRHDIPRFAKVFFDVDLHPGQVKWSTQGLKAKERMLAPGNRWGKSFIQAIKFLHRNFYQVRDEKYHGKEYQTANISITLDQARIVFDSALQLSQNSPRFSWAIRDHGERPFPFIIFRNAAVKGLQDSVFWARSTQRRGIYILGHTYDYINWDEPAYDPSGEWILNNVIRMRLADRDGDLDFSSTPNRRNWYFHQFNKGSNGDSDFFSMSGSSRENPFISARALERLASTMTEKAKLQNMDGLFVAAGGAFEQGIDIALNADLPLHQDPVEGHCYVTGSDPAKRQDWFTIATLDVTKLPFTLVDLVRFQKVAWPVAQEKLEGVVNRYHSDLVIDATGVGEVLSDYLSIKKTNFFFQGKKAQLIENFVLGMEQGKIVYPFHRQLYDELSFYELDDKNLITDCVMALALAYWQASKLNVSQGESASLESSSFFSVKHRWSPRCRGRIYPTRTDSELAELERRHLVHA